ncbi:hypothetical protein LINPERHAP1_LOCUS21731 [Linum perenne]
MARLRRPGRGMNVKEIGQKLILFRFYHVADLKGVCGPWTFNSSLLVLRVLQPGELPTMVPFNVDDFLCRSTSYPQLFVRSELLRFSRSMLGASSRLMIKLSSPKILHI